MGIAAAETMPAGELAGLKGDFDKINGVLANLVGDVQGELAAIWPVLKLLNSSLGNVETAIINFNMEKPAMPPGHSQKSYFPYLKNNVSKRSSIKMK